MRSSARSMRMSTIMPTMNPPMSPINKCLMVPGDTGLNGVAVCMTTSGSGVVALGSRSRLLPSSLSIWPWVLAAAFCKVVYSASLPLASVTFFSWAAMLTLRLLSSAWTARMRPAVASLFCCLMMSMRRCSFSTLLVEHLHLRVLRLPNRLPILHLGLFLEELLGGLGELRVEFAVERRRRRAIGAGGRPAWRLGAGRLGHRCLEQFVRREILQARQFVVQLRLLIFQSRKKGRTRWWPAPSRRPYCCPGDEGLEFSLVAGRVPRAIASTDPSCRARSPARSHRDCICA